MKIQIYTLYISIFLYTIHSVTAAWAMLTLKPSLISQMHRQAVIDIKNRNTDALAAVRARARIARAKRQRRLLAQQKNKTIVRKKIASTQWSTVQNASIPVSMPTLQSNFNRQVATIPEQPIMLTPPPYHNTKTKTVRSSTPSSNTPSPANVDMHKVRSTWLAWYNDARAKRWLSPYIYDARLEPSAYDWNKQFARSRWKNHHTRNPWDGYYNFRVIDQWFKNRWINPPIKNRAKHTENVWYGYYHCTSGDCTDSLIRSIRSTFNFFMSEASYNGSHYRSIMQSNFSKIGLNIITVPAERRYYITIHYITQ